MSNFNEPVWVQVHLQRLIELFYVLLPTSKRLFPQATGTPSEHYAMLSCQSWHCQIKVYAPDVANSLCAVCENFPYCLPPEPQKDFLGVQEIDLGHCGSSFMVMTSGLKTNEICVVCMTVSLHLSRDEYFKTEISVSIEFFRIHAEFFSSGGSKTAVAKK